jgi:hypothetical protein
MGSKRIGTFKKFLSQQRMKKINESNLSISVDFWDQAIIEVLQEIEKECSGYLVWETIIKYCKDKWSILGRILPQPEYDDNILTQHIKDLIFQFHGDSFYTDWKCDLGWDNQQVHSKGLVIEELAAVILEKVKEKAKPQGEPETGNPTGTLSDREEVKMVPMKTAPSYDDEYCEDLPYEYESHRVRPVKGFMDYTKLNETVAMIDIESEEECIRYCMDLVKKNVGSLDPVEILDVALQAASAEVKLEVVKNYFRHMIYDYLCNEKGQVKIVGIGDPKDVQENVPEEVFEQGLEILCGDIADAVIDRLAEENGFGYEKV